MVCVYVRALVFSPTV